MGGKNDIWTDTKIYLASELKCDFIYILLVVVQICII